MATQRAISAFVPVTCRCGKTLRAKREQVGTEIRCWSCQRMVPVPRPREPLRVFRTLSDGALDVLRGSTMSWVVAGSGAVTLGLGVSRVGIGLACGLLILGVAAYGRSIRRTSDPALGPGERWWRMLVPASIVAGVLGPLMVAGTIWPLWAHHAGYHQSPRLDRTGLGIVALAWLLAPLGIWLTSANGRDGRLRVREALGLTFRYPMAVFAALAIVPAGLVVLEAGLALLLYLQGNLAFFTLDFLPMPDDVLLYGGIPFFGTIDFRSIPAEQYVSKYVHCLGRGYSIVGAVPPSLSLMTRAEVSSSGIYLPEEMYAFGRFLATFAIVGWSLMAFAIQARWLGLIATLERGLRPETGPRPGVPNLSGPPDRTESHGEETRVGGLDRGDDDPGRPRLGLGGGEGPGGG